MIPTAQQCFTSVSPWHNASKKAKSKRQHNTATDFN